MPMQMHSNVRDGYYRICRALINLVPYLSSRNVRTPRIAHTTPSASDQMRWGGNQGSFVKGLCVDEDIYYLLQKYFNAENIKLFVNNHFLNPSSVVHSWSAVQNSELCTASVRTAVAHFFCPVCLVSGLSWYSESREWRRDKTSSVSFQWWNKVLTNTTNTKWCYK